MEFNKLIRGAKREMNDFESVYAVLDAGFICHVGFQHQGQTMMIPTAYGRKDDCLYLHGSSKNFMFSQILNNQTTCIAVTHLDGIVLAKNLFHSSVNYRSAVLFGKAVLVEHESERIEALKIISEHIMPGRTAEVELGSDLQINATMVIKFTIERASVKIRAGGPMGDEAINNPVWSGHIPLELKAKLPVADEKFGVQPELSNSVKHFIQTHQ